MTYDQAQSPRLGQRVPVETTYVQSYNVDPTDDVADLIEAAWPGMLIHRADRDILQIYDGELGAWVDIGGGSGGSATYVGTTEPTGGVYAIGDIWYDSDDGYRAYVWDGTNWTPTKAGGGILTFRSPDPPTSVNIGDVWIDSNDGEKMYRANKVGVSVISVEDPPGTWSDGWVLIQDHGIPTAQATADRKTRAYYLPGKDTSTDPPTFTPPTEAPDHTPLSVGDIWYQTDDGNRPWFWTGSVWVDASDPNAADALQRARNNSDAITDINIALENLTLTGSSTNNTADTADGRISTSDYIPGPDDLTYSQFRTELDTSVEPPVPIQVEYQAARVNGSIWFTQTRPRKNHCTNPSFEVNANFWTADGATIVRDNTVPNVPAGSWTLKVTNTGSGEHMAIWGAATPTQAQAGQTWSASIFAELISGNGSGVTLQLVWVDSNGTVLDVEVSPLYQLVLNAFSDKPPGTTNEWRMWVAGVAPANTAGLYVRVVSPAGLNDSDVWHAGALLLEPEKDLGRYFDGDSYDGFWDGTQQNSTSQLHGDKIFQVWELRDGAWQRKFFTDDTAAPIDGSQLVGNIDGELIRDNTLVVDKQYAALVMASEALAVGDIVNVYNDLGVFLVRRADASLGKNYEAHGFVIDTTAAFNDVRVYHTGYVDKGISGLSPGTQWLSTTPGRAVRKPPAGAGVLVQQVGFAPSATILNFQPRLAIKVS